MSALELKTEIEQANARIGELETQKTEQAVAFDATQRAFIEGKAGVDKLHAEQSQLTLIEQAIAALKATLEKLTSAFRTQSETETRHKKIAKMTASANAVETLLDDYLKTRSDLNDLVAKYAETLIEQATAYQNKQAEYQSIMRDVDPSPTLAELQLSDRARQLASATHLNHEPVEYSDVIALAENQLAARINKTERAARRIEFEARRKETANAQAA